MALFKNRGQNDTRAIEILKDLAPKEEKPVVEAPAPEVIPPADPPQPETPPATPPVTPEEKPIEDNAEGAPPAPAQPEKPEDASSDTPPVETPPVQTPEPPVVPEVTDELIFSKLSETLGREL